MRGNERRRSPPPRRDDRRFGGGGPPPAGWDRRRPRSASPPDRFRRSPPGKRFRQDEYDEYDRYPGSGGRFDRGDGHGRRRYDDRYDDRGPPPPRVPLTFVEFVRDLPPHVPPDQAMDEYRRYMADWWGDAIKAEFEERKGDPQLRRRFDPREIGRIVQQRNELAQQAARAFAEELEAGSLSLEEQGPPGPEGFAEPGRGGEDAEPAPAEQAPPLTWQPAQLAADLALAKQLMQTVDKEKGIEGNPLAPAAAAAPAAEAEGGEGAEGAEAEQQGDQQAEQQGSGPADMDAELSPEEQQAKLDQVLLYLWRVHGIDFYGGREFNNPAERRRSAARRTLRGPRPSDEELAAAAEAQAAETVPKAEPEAGKEEAEAEAEATKPSEAAAGKGEQQQGQQEEQEEQQQEQEQQGGAEPAAAASPTAKDAEGQRQGAGKEVVAQQQEQQQQPDGKQRRQGGSEEAKEYEHRVTGFWRYRIDKGDPLEIPLQRKRVEEAIEKFVEAQIVKLDDNKWGNKLSQKLFMGREFVVKHIRNKHGHVLDAEREQLQEEIFWENFRSFKQEEQRRQEEEQERVMAGAAAAGGFGDRGRGGRGMLPMEPAAMPINPGMVMAPIIMPAAGGMAPIIMPMEMVMGMAGGMGGRGGRGGPGMRGGMGGRGGRGGGPGPILPGAKLDAGGAVREYYDLDAPANNRAVLDYGDL
ncbi:hypothetical protein ABPG75_005158 [Micractinium tetrahymenae]